MKIEMQKMFATISKRDQVCLTKWNTRKEKSKNNIDIHQRELDDEENVNGIIVLPKVLQRNPVKEKLIGFTVLKIGTECYISNGHGILCAHSTEGKVAFWMEKIFLKDSFNVEQRYYCPKKQKTSTCQKWTCKHKENDCQSNLVNCVNCKYAVEVLKITNISLVSQHMTNGEAYKKIIEK